MAKSDLTGRVFGWLTVVEEAGRDKWKNVLWRCACKCGGEVVVKRGSLISGVTVSCGCYHKAVVSKTHKKHGHNSLDGRSATYTSWANMIQRCRNPNNPRYKNYGGAGVCVCQRWMSFDLFLEDMGHKPKRGWHITRNGDAGNYEPGNCEWKSPKANRAEQAQARQLQAIR